MSSWVVPAPTVPPLRDPIAKRTACDAPIAVFADGKKTDSLCEEDARRLGLTVLDLSSSWLPPLLADGRQPYRHTLRALADGRFSDLPEGHRAHRDRFLELYGVMPALALVRQRLADDARHSCHAGVDDAALRRLKRPLDAWRAVAKQRADRWTVKTLRKRLEFGLFEHNYRHFDELKDDARYGPTYRQWARAETRVSAIAAAQAHLRCEGLLGKAEDRVLDHATTRALSLYLRKQAIITWTLDREAAAVMATDSRVLDYRTALRVLRERVVTATGLIEDGSAAGRPERVLGHVLEADGFHRTGAHPPLPNGAPDLIARATARAAMALGWTDPASTLAALTSLPPSVAVRLPRLPRYHAKHMKLRAEIDRGDVRYDYAFTGLGHRRYGPPARRPVLVLYARDGDREIPLVRWGTTIGGWKPERIATGKVAMSYKESPVGPRIWRDLLVTPRWIPPRSTPKRDLVVPTRNGWRLKRELIGPSYASAYGLVMLIHHRVDGARLTDQGIRTHGTVSYDSIHKGTSHGCHRLHNHRAVRLGQFLIQHRTHIVRAAEPLPLTRTFPWRGRSMRMKFTTRGFRYELDPPVRIEVKRGRVIGRSRPVATPVRLPASLARRFAHGG